MRVNEQNNEYNGMSSGKLNKDMHCEQKFLSFCGDVSLTKGRMTNKQTNERTSERANE